ARYAPLAPLLPPFHGEIGALLVAAHPRLERGRRLPGAPRPAGRPGDRDGRRAGPRRERGHDVPRGDATEEGAREEERGAAAVRGALAGGVPLVPAAVKGTDRLLRLGKLSVAYGPPVEIDDLRVGETGEAARVATGRLMAKIYELEESL